jgi:LacI family transcriptional regulator
MKARTKMSDVARELGVSTVTVSRALSSKDGVGDSLRNTITQKALEMGYIYNSLPRNMLLGRNYNIGILVASKYLGASSFYWIFYQELLRILKQTSYLGILEIAGDEDRANTIVPSFISANRVDGLILLGQFSDKYLAMITSHSSHCVFLDFYSDIGGCDCIVSNNFLGSYSITKLLIAAGHKKIAFIGSTSATTSILDRYMGFCKAMVEAELPYDAAIEDRNQKGIYLTEIPLRSDYYTAYVCNNDRLAGLVIMRLRQFGLQVPRDISIVGFDNENEAVTDGIGVTSLELNVSGMCELAVKALIERIESRDYTSRGSSFINGQIIIKQSIAPPRT